MAELEQEVEQLKRGIGSHEVSSFTSVEGHFIKPFCLQTLMSMEKPLDKDVSLSPDDQKLCHKILYQFFHGKIDNPVHAGKQKCPTEA